MTFNHCNKTWVWRTTSEALTKDCVVPRFGKGKGSVMLWGAIWHGGRSELSTFDCSQSEGKRGAITGKVYTAQIIQTALKVVWRRVNTAWRAYGGARIVEDNAPVHTKESIEVGRKQRFKYLDHPPFFARSQSNRELLGYSQARARQT